MTVYVVLFRGVGGATQLPVKPLRAALTAAGYGNVATYINSGNGVLSSPKTAADVAADIATITKRDFGFDKDIHVVSRAEWGELMGNNPFPGAVETPTLLHAAWLERAPDPERVEALRGFARDGEGIAVVGRVAYLHTPGGFGKSKLAERFDKGIGVANTARNWNTVLALAKLADAVG